VADLLRAISDSTRRQILSNLQRHPDEDRSVDEIAEQQGIHRTVAFEHLEMLAEVRLVTRGARRGGRGRPARTYRHAGVAAEVSYPPRQHRLLASLLATGLGRSGKRGIAIATDEGRRVGAELAAGSGGDAEALTLLGQVGASYELSGDQVIAHDCIFREACLCASQVVCGAHAGLIEGALAACGRRHTVRPLGPDDTGGCGFQLGRA